MGTLQLAALLVLRWSKSAKTRARAAGVERPRLSAVSTNSFQTKQGQNTKMKLIKPHGGTLVNREVTGLDRRRLIEESADMPRLQLNAREISDLELIAIGAYSP